MSAVDVAAFHAWAHGHAAGLDATLVLAVPHDDGWRSRCFQLADLERCAAAAVAASDKGMNVYTRVHLLAEPVDRFHRGTTGQTRWVTYLAADVDIAGPGHKPPPGTELPPTIDAALELIDATLPPSSIIASGGGLYPIWRLDAALDLAPDGMAAEISTIGRRIDLALAGHGWHVDRTLKDLTRVIRPPGVVNHKPGRDPRPVTVLRGYADGAADYSIADLDAMLPALPEPVTVKPSRPRSSTTGATPWEIFNDRYDVDTVLAADPNRSWEQVKDQNGWPAWRYVGSESAYSIKLSPTTGAVVIWSSTIAAALNVDPGDALDLWGLACGLAGRDATIEAKWSL